VVSPGGGAAISYYNRKFARATGVKNCSARPSIVATFFKFDGEFIVAPARRASSLNAFSQDKGIASAVGESAA